MNTTQVSPTGPDRAALRAPAGVVLRSTRAGDDARLTEMLSGLSVTSAYLRFLTGLGRPSPRLIARLLRRDATHGAWLAEADDTTVGHVMWVLEDGVVDLGVVVTDAWQRRGVGRWLVQSALAEAAVAGAVAVRLDVHVENHVVLAMLWRAMPDARVTREADLLTFRAPMTSTAPAPPPTRYAAAGAGTPVSRRVAACLG